MKTLDKIAFGFTLLLIAILAGCAPTVTKTGFAQYTVVADKGTFVIIGASEEILSWSPESGCVVQDNFYSAKSGTVRAIKCVSPGTYSVDVALDVNGDAAEIVTVYINKDGVPISVPK